MLKIDIAATTIFGFAASMFAALAWMVKRRINKWDDSAEKLVVVQTKVGYIEDDVKEIKLLVKEIHQNGSDD